jgi:uncharacterized repeat protein (TIGR01451 family)
VVSVQKSASVSSVDAGGDVTYTLAVTNAGTGPTQSDTLVLDPLPAGTTLVGTPSCPTSLPTGVTCTSSEVSYNGVTAVSWQLGPGIAAGAAPIDLTLEVQATGATSTIVNTAEYSGDGCSTGPMCPSNEVTVSVVQLPPTPVTFASFTVVKSASVSSLTAGSTTPVVFTLTAHNTSTVSSTEPLVITDTVPAGTTYVAGSASCPAGLSSTSTPSCTVAYDSSTGTLTWTIGAGVAAGASEAVSFSVTLNPGTSTTAVTNTGTWTGQGCATTAGCATNTVTISVAAVKAAGSGSWSFTKAVSASSVVVGSTTVLTYTITGTNVGTAATTAPAVVTDTVPAGTTYVAGSATCSASGVTCSVSYDAASGVITWVIGPGAAAGATVRLSFATTADQADPVGTSISNTAYWSGPGCATTGGCATNPVSTSVVSGASPAPALKGSSGGAIPGATSVHTGEPWAGADRWAGLVAALGGVLLVAGGRRRRRARTA